MKPTEKEILAFIDSKYKPAIILLGGSREQGREHENSDWDLYLIGDFATVARLPQAFHGADLDIAVYPWQSLTDDVLSIYFGPLSKLRVLKDTPNADGARVAQATQAAYEKGPAPLTEAERTRLAFRLSRLLTKAQRYSNNPVAATYILAEFYRELISAWFHNQNRWCLPIAEALSAIGNQDPKFAALLVKWVNSQDVSEQCEVGHHLVHHLFALTNS